jgi:DNA-binding transcriptional regulator/RsmH inhibitor MraZ
LEAELSGTHIQAFDPRNRVAIPVKLLRGMRKLEGVTETDPMPVVLTVTPRERIGVYPSKRYLQMVNELREEAKYDPDADELLTTYRNYMEEQEVDAQNRIRIPQWMAEHFELSGDVHVMGSGDMLEIVNSKTYAAQMKERLVLMKQQNEKAILARKRPE